MAQPQATRFAPANAANTAIIRDLCDGSWFIAPPSPCAAHVKMRMPVARLTGMRVLFGLFGHRHTDQPAVAYAAFRNDVLRQMAHLRLLAAQHGNFHAASM